MQLLHLVGFTSLLVWSVISCHHYNHTTWHQNLKDHTYQTNWHSQSSRVLFETLIVCQLVKKSPPPPLFPSLGNPKVHCRFHDNEPLVLIPIQINPVHSLPSYFFKTHPNVIFQSTFGSSNWPLFLKLLHQNPPARHWQYTVWYACMYYGNYWWSTGLVYVWLSTYLLLFLAKICNPQTLTCHYTAAQAWLVRTVIRFLINYLLPSF